MERTWLLASYGLLWILVLVISFITLSLMRLIGQMHQRLGPAPSLVAQAGPQIGDLFSELLSRAKVEEGGALRFPKQGDSLLVFVSPGCTVCKTMSRALLAFRSHYAPDLDVLLISTSESKEHNDELLAGADLPLLSLPKVALSAGITGTPYSLWLDPESVVMAKGLTSNLEHLQSLQNARKLGVSSIDDYHRKANSTSRRDGSNDQNHRVG